METVGSDSYHAAQKFNFSVNTATDKDGPLTKIEKLTITWNGKGYKDGAGNDGLTLYIWNGTAYEELSSTSLDTEVTLSGDCSSSITNYVNSGNVTIIAIQKSQGTDPFEQSILETDYVNLTVTHHHSNM